MSVLFPWCGDLIEKNPMSRTSKHQNYKQQRNIEQMKHHQNRFIFGTDFFPLKKWDVFFDSCHLSNFTSQPTSRYRFSCLKASLFDTSPSKSTRIIGIWWFDQQKTDPLPLGRHLQKANKNGVLNLQNVWTNAWFTQMHVPTIAFRL